MAPKKLYSFRIDIDTLKELRSAAQEEQKTVSELLLEYVKDGLESRAGRQQLPEQNANRKSEQKFIDCSTSSLRACANEQELSAQDLKSEIAKDIEKKLREEMDEKLRELKEDLFSRL